MSPNKQALSRRELLKALTALGGAVAASSMLPGKWAKPEIGAGVLPAHAQGTQDLFIENLTLDMVNNIDPSAPETKVVWKAEFNYNDPLGEVGPASQVYVNIDSECFDTVYEWKTLNEISALITGDGSLGTISFNFVSDCANCPWTLHVTLKAGTRISNTLDQGFPC